MSKIEVFKEVFMSIFAIVIVSMGVSMVGALIFHSVPPENKDIINVSLGSVLAMNYAVVTYYFGSSKSSANKDALLAKSQLIPDKQVTVSETDNKPAI